ncbi:MazG-like family protein [Kitasatospora purpeofusca]|uniref:MazG-like family protein n=1 Tax=Kitasatospora purpeofusca TaxID=67352 RepID=UPI00225119F5|nr:MazG-like family protein [Kitasatospora purpeofusca]MCX4758653.1 MazG-like family protein [Kitasatospora purpeofusca]WSR30912.1 MazG-like family protein [Kitasatospora purpeofusca]
MEQTWTIVNSLAARLDAHYDRSDELRWTVQALKLQEEAGEVAEAVIGALGANPRKGFSHDWDDVRKETCDVALSALVMLARMGGDPRRFFDEHLRAVAARDTTGSTPA